MQARDWWLRGLAIAEAARQSARDFLFPACCLLCGELPDSQFPQWCSDCLAELTEGNAVQCMRCGATVGLYSSDASGCLHCRDEKYHFSQVWSLGDYTGALRHAVTQAKSPYGLAIGRGLADLFLERHFAHLLTESIDAVVPVPHDWWRTVTQLQLTSETFAERLAHRLQRRYAPELLQKPRPTPRQASLSPHERRRQQRDAFAVPPGIRVEGVRLLLVDDVVTTGATANAAAKALRSAGATDVLVATLARGIGRVKH